MNEVQSVKRFGNHENAFGFLRLFFAALVIASHTPEIADGNRSRELLTNTFGTISFGSVAIHAFFLISGYLIVGSYLKDSRPLSYLKKRIVRIYPAFVVASLFCILLVAPLVGSSLFDAKSWMPQSTARIVALQPPEMMNAFIGTPYAALNGSMWTIAYEFRCYILALLLGAAGAYRRPEVILALTAVGLTTSIFVPDGFLQGVNRALPGSGYWIGDLSKTATLTSAFLVGSLFLIYRDKIVFRQWLAALAVLCLIISLSIGRVAVPGVILAGSYLVFYVASINKGIITRINNKNDVSYGLYLYAWPVGKLIFWFIPDVPLWAAGCATLVIAYGLGWASWLVIEKPALSWLTRSRGRLV
jgi:peptidoglycan/LPS O-acetylase OafA/YrhL